MIRRYLHLSGLLLGAGALLTACGDGDPRLQDLSTTSTSRQVFQTVGGKRFETAEARARYLNASETARRERETIALERYRQERIAGDLGALQRQRHLRRADRAETAARQAETEAKAARARSAAALRTDRQLEVANRQRLNRIQSEADRHREDRAERIAAEARSEARNAQRRAEALRRRAAYEASLSDAAAQADARAPWRRLLGYRRKGETLPEFRRRVVEAIRKASAEGRSVHDLL